MKLWCRTLKSSGEKEVRHIQVCPPRTRFWSKITCSISFCGFAYNIYQYNIYFGEYYSRTVLMRCTAAEAFLVYPSSTYSKICCIWCLASLWGVGFGFGGQKGSVCMCMWYIIWGNPELQSLNLVMSRDLQQSRLMRWKTLVMQRPQTRRASKQINNSDSIIRFRNRGLWSRIIPCQPLLQKAWEPIPILAPRSSLQRERVRMCKTVKASVRKERQKEPVMAIMSVAVRKQIMKLRRPPMFRNKFSATRCTEWNVELSAIVILWSVAPNSTTW